MISFRARRRQVVRQERGDQIGREIREAVDLIARCEAGDPEALRQAEANQALAESWTVPAENDYPEPCDLGPEDDYPEPGDALRRRPGESERAWRRRIRPGLAERRAEQLLGRGHWRADRPMPGAIREALCVLSLSPRELRRLLVAVWDRPEWSPREVAPMWAPTLRELAGLAGPAPREAAHWLEVCPRTGPPAAGTAAVGTLPDRSGGAVIYL